MATDDHAIIDTYIGIGSNLCDSRLQVEQAIAELRQLSESNCVAQSRLYRSPPLGPQNQPDYINAVARLRTRLEPLKLLDELQAIETQRGRVRSSQRWGPRIIDLDILLYGDWQIDDPRLIVPHPELSRRAFVLYPLMEVNPELEIPGWGALGELIHHCPRGDLTPC